MTTEPDHFVGDIVPPDSTNDSYGYAGEKPLLESGEEVGAGPEIIDLINANGDSAEVIKQRELLRLLTSYPKIIDFFVYENDFITPLIINLIIIHTHFCCVFVAFRSIMVQLCCNLSRNYKKSRSRGYSYPHICHSVYAIDAIYRGSETRKTSNQ
ncbi:MAG: hypothetical protein MUO76_21185 [Anaerolineaceae bacterium]|nr:hypothetical protein [Anaerolineaceae bacterium]